MSATIGQPPASRHFGHVHRAAPIAALAPARHALMALAALGCLGAVREGERVVVLAPVIEGSIPLHVRSEVQKRLNAGIARGAFAVVDPGDGPTRCSDPACYREVASAANATHVIELTIEIQDRDYQLTMNLLRGSSGEVLATSSDRCEICGFEELGETVEGLAASVRRKIEASVSMPPMLAVTTNPAGAEVVVDGEPVGTTPLELAVTPGEHDIEVRKAGHFSQRQRVAFVEGVRERIAVDLEAVPKAAADIGTSKRSKALRGVGWTALAAGIGSLAAGIALIVLDENEIRSDCEGDNVDVDGRCKWRWNTLGGGITLTVVGGALAATGITLVAIDRRQYKRARAALRLLPGGIAIAGRF